MSQSDQRPDPDPTTHQVADRETDQADERDLPHRHGGER